MWNKVSEWKMWNSIFSCEVCLLMKMRNTYLWWWGTRIRSSDDQ